MTEDEPEGLHLRVRTAERRSRRSLWRICSPNGTNGDWRSALRLHFCRMVVENCGGEIGCAPLPAGGNRFWIRLPKAGAA